MNKKRAVKLKLTILAAILILLSASVTYAEEESGKYVPTRKGAAVTAGMSYDPNSDFDFYMLSGFYLFDYDRVWKHRAPENLRFKVEGTAGVARDYKTRFVTSVNMFALHYLDFLKTGKLKPYVEGGIGIIYTDFQVSGQGSRINFNPQIGLGTEIEAGSHETFFFAVRFHHLSNANLKDENRGVNSVMCMFGCYF